MQDHWSWPRRAVAGASSLAALSAAMPAYAVGGLPDITPIADQVGGVYNLIFWITTLIFVGVWTAMAYILVKYRFRPGRQAIQTHGNTALEVIWTILPTIALIVIAIPTYKAMQYMENIPEPDLTVEVIGHQWYWEYKYPDQGITVSNKDLVVPANKVVKVLVSSADVVHSWGVPEFGFKLDAIPGHINEGWFYAKKTGTYDGYCYQLCGTLHANMLTKVRALDDAAFAAWLKENGAKTAAALAAPVTGAPAEAAPVAAAKPLTAAELKKRGEEVYAANCASCHQGSGEGMAGTFPPIAGAEQANGDPKAHIQIVLKGLSGPITVKGQQYNGAMPPFGHLSDEDVAAVITYERTSWGNKGSEVTPDQVKAVRGN